MHKEYCWRSIQFQRMNICKLFECFWFCKGAFPEPFTDVSEVAKHFRPLYTDAVKGYSDYPAMF